MVYCVSCVLLSFYVIHQLIASTMTDHWCCKKKTTCVHPSVEGKKKTNAKGCWNYCRPHCYCWSRTLLARCHCLITKFAQLASMRITDHRCSAGALCRGPRCSTCSRHNRWQESWKGQNIFWRVHLDLVFYSLFAHRVYKISGLVGGINGSIK